MGKGLGSGPEVEIKTSSWKLGKYEALRPWKNSSKPFSQSQRFVQTVTISWKKSSIAGVNSGLTLALVD